SYTKDEELLYVERMDPALDPIDPIFIVAPVRVNNSRDGKGERACCVCYSGVCPLPRSLSSEDAGFLCEPAEDGAEETEVEEEARRPEDKGPQAPIGQGNEDGD